MDTFLYFLLAFGYICLLLWGIFLAKSHGLWNLTNVLLLVIIGLTYDNFILAIGRFIGEGSMLEVLSYLRFWFHALLTPTLILFAWSICFRTGLPWAQKTFWKLLAYAMTLGLILYELITSVMGLKLEANWENGILTYESMGQSSPFMVIVITAVLVIVGFILMLKFRFYWLFIGTLAMIAGSLLAKWIKITPFMNGLEFILIVSLLLTYQFLNRNKHS